MTPVCGFVETAYHQGRTTARSWQTTGAQTALLAVLPVGFPCGPIRSRGSIFEKRILIDHHLRCRWHQPIPDHSHIRIPIRGRAVKFDISRSRPPYRSLEVRFFQTVPPGSLRPIATERIPSAARGSLIDIIPPTPARYESRRRRRTTPAAAKPSKPQLVGSGMVKS